MGYLELLVHFYLKNHARVVKLSHLNFAPLNLYPTISYIIIYAAFRRHKFQQRVCLWGINCSVFNKYSVQNVVCSVLKFQPNL